MKIGKRQERMLAFLTDAGEPVPVRHLGGHFGGIVRAMQIAQSLEKRGLVDRDFFSWSINDIGREALKQEVGDE